MAAPIWPVVKKARPTQLSVFVEIAGGRYFISIMEMALIPRRLAGPIVGNFMAHRDRIIRSIDLLFTGV